MKFILKLCEILKVVQFLGKWCEINLNLSEILLKMEWNFSKNCMKLRRIHLKLGEIYLKTVWNSPKNSVKFF